MVLGVVKLFFGKDNEQYWVFLLTPNIIYNFLKNILKPKNKLNTYIVKFLDLKVKKKN